MLKRILGRMRWYRALAWSHERMAAEKRAYPGRDQLRTIGPNSVLMPRVCITHPGRVHIGDWSTIYSDTMIHSQGGLHVGDYAGIGYRTTILTFNHNYRNADAVPYDNRFFLQPVIIRDLAWIGWNSCILPGVEIGEGAIVGMGSVVTKNVEPLSIVLGNPAVVVGRRSEAHFEKCRDAGKLVPHRLRAMYEDIEETIPLMTRRRYARELADLGLLDRE